MVGDHFLLITSLNILISWAFLFYKSCDSGESIASGFSDLYESIYDLPWHLCSVELQQYVAFMLKIAQLPVNINGVCNLKCSHETFKKVCPKQFIRLLFPNVAVLLHFTLMIVYDFRVSTQVILTLCCFVDLANIIATQLINIL